LEKKHLDAAIAAYRQAIAINPNLPEAHADLGNALISKGQLEEAIAACRQAIALKPEFAQAYNNLGVALESTRQFDEAIVVCRTAIALKPDFAEAHYNLGNALAGKGLLDEAIAAYRQALVVRPNYTEAYNNLGIVLKDNGQLEEAISAYHRAIELDPRLANAYSNLGVVLNDKGELDEAITAFRAAIAIEPENASFGSNLLFTMNFHPGYDAETIAEEHRRWNHQHAEPLRKFIQIHSNDRSPDRRLRIGYVSPDFRNHPVGRFLLPLLANHDKSQVDIFGYSDVAYPDEITRRLQSCTDHWRSIVGISDAAAVDMIRQDKIDILVDLTMHMAQNRLGVFARKPAPVQVTYLAYCSTTGLETIDYRLSDPYLDPPGEDESRYSEQTIRLPQTYWCYEPIIDSPEISPLPALAQGFITFGCLNNFCKISELALETWARILRAVPNSQLLLSARQGTHRQRISRRLERDGIEPHRVQFADYLPIEKYFDLYRRLDIALDTFPYAGGTTTCDALWMGVPVVSLAGKTAVGRGGLSILSNIGVPELVASSEEQYVGIAIELAKDTRRLTDLRLTLRQRMQRSPLMDAPKFTRSIEAAYRRMWHTWCATRIGGV
jgi:protein O-GlcNAc transferase